MQTVLTLAFNQIRRQLAERGSLITLFVVPIIMMIAIGSFNSGRPTTSVLDVARSDGPLADNFVSLLREEGQKQVAGVSLYVICDLSKPADQPAECKLNDADLGSDLAAAGKKRLDDGVTVGLLVLPADFDAKLRAGQQAAVTVDAKGDPNQTQVLNQKAGAVSARMSGALLAAQISAAKVGGDPALYDKVYSAAEAIWAKDPVQVTEESSTTSGISTGSGFGQSAPGIGAMFVMINAMALAQLFLIERNNWTLQRLMVMPISRTQLLAGKLVGQFLLGLITYAVMIGAGVALGVRWGDWLAVIAVVLAYTLAVTALALAVSTLVRTIGQAGGIGFLIPMVLSPLGGAWWPLDLTPQAMQTVGKIVSPVAWSQDAFTKIIFYGGTLGDVLPNVAVLLLYTAVFFVFGLSRFRYE